MNHQTSIPVSDSLRSEESTSRERSSRELHERICFFIALLAGLFQLKQGVLDTDYLTFVTFIVVLMGYIGSLIGPAYIRQARPNYSDLAKFMDKLSLPFGALVLILELMILVRVLGLAALCVWIVRFVSFVANYLFMYLEALYTSAVAGVVQAYEKFKEYLKKNMIIVRYFTMHSEDQTGLP